MQRRLIWMFEMKNYDDMKIEIDEFKKKYPKAFANINDKNELTVIIEKSKVKKEDVINIENDWKLITFDTVLDFSLTGFISKISSALAEANISIFVVSSYSTDHILVKKENLDETLKILRKLKMNI
ncbi:MAG TPA: ACT domain-containing protein [Candidatus Nanoarchaeia archaeon]|nr:ACT domain-containing protein [Candidatus Nanoarchaeia archaeon]